MSRRKGQNGVPAGQQPSVKPGGEANIAALFGAQGRKTPRATAMAPEGARPQRPPRQTISPPQQKSPSGRVGSTATQPLHGPQTGEIPQQDKRQMAGELRERDDTCSEEGNALKCVECYNITSPQCTGQTKDCDGGICMSGLISLGDYTLFGRSCAPNAETCGVYGSITSTSRAMLSTSCCTTPGCTPEELKLPSTSTMKNGVTCSTCASSSQDQCKIECVGDEKNCASVDLSTAGPGLGTKIRGCATDSVCNFGDHKFDIDGVVITLGIVCNSASAVVLQYCTFFLTLGFAIFMAKPFF